MQAAGNRRVWMLVGRMLIFVRRTSNAISGILRSMYTSYSMYIYRYVLTTIAMQDVVEGVNVLYRACVVAAGPSVHRSLSAIALVGLVRIFSVGLSFVCPPVDVCLSVGRLGARCIKSYSGTRYTCMVCSGVLYTEVYPLFQPL